MEKTKLRQKRGKMNKKYIKLGIGIAVFLTLAMILIFSGINNDNVTGEVTSENSESSELAGDPNKVTIYFFWGEGCPHCAEEKPFLEGLEQEYGDEIEIKRFETGDNKDNVLLFKEVAQAYGIQAQGVPTTFIGEKNWMGFSSSIASEMEQYIEKCIETRCENKAKEALEDFEGQSYSEDSSEGTSGKDSEENQIDELCLHAFMDYECDQCKDVEDYLEDLSDEYGIEIDLYNVSKGDDKKLFQDFKEKYGLKADAYPVVFIGDKYIMGKDSIKKALEDEIEICLEDGCPCPISRVKPYTPITTNQEDVTSGENQTIDLLGKEINVGNMPLVASTFIISFVDGFNPCSLWVITFLLGIVILTGSRKKVFAVGFTYLAVAAAAYGAFILGFISIFSYIGYLMWVRVVVASIAIIFALVNIKDFFWYKKGISFTISDKHKPKIYKKMRNLMRPENNTKTLILGSAIMALGITLVELPCTAGFPMVWSNIVAAQDIETSFFITLFLIYLLTYFLIELAIFLSVVFTLRVSKFEKKHGRLLKLIGGMIMLALAMVLLIDPDLLNDIGMTVLLFVVAIGLAFLIAWIYKKKEGFEENKFKEGKEENSKDSEEDTKKYEEDNKETSKESKESKEENIKKDKNIENNKEEEKNE